MSHLPPVSSGDTAAKAVSSSPFMVDSLRKRSDFLRVQGSRHRFSRPGFLLTLLAMPSLGTQIAVGYTVTKKLGNAVTRNRTKRRLRAIAVPLLTQQGLPGHAYVWIARGGIEAMDFAALENEMRWAVRKLHAMLAADPTPQEGGGRLRGRGSKKHKAPKGAVANAATPGGGAS